MSYEFGDDPGGIFSAGIDVEDLFNLNDKIRETSAKIEWLEQKRKEVLDSTGDQSELNSIDERLCEQARRLKRFKQARSDILRGYE